MSTIPRVSVVVPAHDAAAYIASSLEALCRSDIGRDAFEIIVVDDGSADATAEIASRYADIVLSTASLPAGPASARNLGAKSARADVIAFVDSDVAVHHDALSLLLSRLQSDSEIVAVFGSYDDSPEGKGVVSQYRNLLHHFAHNESAGYVTTFWAGCGAVRAGAFQKVGGFDGAKFPRPQIEDIELGYRLASLGRIVLDPQIQCTHKKLWTLGSMVVTDFRDRAVPWVSLLLSKPSPRRDRTPSLGRRAVLSTGAAAASLLALASVLAGAGWAGIAAAAFFMAVSVLLGWRLHLFMLTKGGVQLFAVSIVLHYLYQAESAVAVPFGAISYMLSSRSAQSAATPAHRAAGERFAPLALGEIGGRIIAFIATAYLARVLGVSAFGQIGFAIAVVAHFGSTLPVGIGEVAARQVARDPTDTPRIASEAIGLRILVAVFAIVAILALSFALPVDDGTRLVLRFYAFSVIPLAFDTSWAYKGLGRTARVGVAMLIDQTVYLALVLILVASRSDVTRVPLLQIAGDLLGAAFLLVPLMRGKWVAPVWKSMRELARQSGMLTVSRIMRAIVVSFDIVLLGILVQTTQVGLYSAAYRIVFFVTAVIFASHVAFLPEILRSSDDAGVLSRVLSRAIALALTVTIPIALGGILIAPRLMTMVFGAEYVGGAVALQLLLASLILLAVHGATHNVFISLHRAEIETGIVAAGVVANVALNLILIPRFGIIGAAVATVAGEAVILFGVITALGRLDIHVGLRDSMPAVLAGAVMAGALLMFGVDRHPLECMVVGGLIYVLALASFALVSARTGDALLAEAQ